MAISWSKTKKIMEEDFLCEKLRKRVEYFFTIYHNAPDKYGRFAVRVDDKELFQSNPYNEYYLDREIIRLAKIYHKEPMSQWPNYEEEYDRLHKEAEINMTKEGCVDSFLVMHYIEDFLASSIEESLYSDNAVIRMFAILDIRVGKRTLLKMKENLSKQPPWLSKFYILRLKAEKLILDEDLNL